MRGFAHIARRYNLPPSQPRFLARLPRWQLPFIDFHLELSHVKGGFFLRQTRIFVALSSSTSFQINAFISPYKILLVQDPGMFKWILNVVLFLATLATVQSKMENFNKVT